MQHATIYVIAWHDDGPTKVGFTRGTSPINRLNTLRAAFPYRLRVYGALVLLEADAIDLERQAHKTLAAKRMRGEWFNVPQAEAWAELKRIATKGYFTFQEWEPTEHERLREKMRDEHKIVDMHGKVRIAHTIFR